MPKKTIVAAVALMLLVVVVATVVPAFIRARDTPATNACASNLRQLEGAKQQWVLNESRGTNAAPTMKELQPYLGRTLICQNGGTYTLGKVGESPRCSVCGQLTP